MWQAIKNRWIAFVVRITPRCADITRLVSQGRDRPLPWRTRLSLRLHFLICVWCERYARHLRFLREAAPRYRDHAVEAEGHQLSAQARQRLKDRLRAAPKE